jgi:adenosylcobinamide-GDP ribazoletransferase
VLATLRPAPLLLAALWCVSRTAMATVVNRVPYARPEPGLASAFAGARLPTLLAAVVVAAAAGLAAVWKVPAGPVAVAAGLVGFGAVLLLAQRRIGGYTGDVLGAAGLVGETVGLLVAAARW